MKLEEAILELEKETNISIPSGEIAHLDATRLLIEAGKRIQAARLQWTDSPLHLLPGETDD